MKNQTPNKPDKMKAQISMLWDAVFNDIPHQLRWQDKKINFILAIVLATFGAAIAKLFLG